MLLLMYSTSEDGNATVRFSDKARYNDGITEVSLQGIELQLSQTQATNVEFNAGGQPDFKSVVPAKTWTLFAKIGAF